MEKHWDGPLVPAGPMRWRIPREYKKGMRVDGIIFIDEEMVPALRKDNAPEQVANVAFIPGIVKASMAMPDIHWGYGFPIGGVAATDPAAGGVVSPGGVGYDINCGVRLIRTNLMEADVRPHMQDLVNLMFSHVPCGVGEEGDVRFSVADEKKVLAEGAAYVVSKGFGRREDVEHIESNGRLPDADPEEVSKRACERGKGQCGTLGAGNHFAEIQVVDEIYDAPAARVFRLEKGSVTIMLHCGSRGLGHQICDDYLKAFRHCPQKYGISLPDAQLICAPVESPEGQSYLKAMRCAANYAWANRQIIMHLIRQAFERHFGRGFEELGMDLIYDVAHNIAKIEEHEVDGRRVKLCVHRKGATRAFPPGHPEVPADYREIGQPVLIPGDMGRNSYLLVGQEQAMRDTFGSTCHGAGRAMSRHEAIRMARGRSIQKELAAKGIIARAKSREGLDEEQPAAYKDVNQVVEVVHKAGLSKKVCRMKPLGVIKG